MDEKRKPRKKAGAVLAVLVLLLLPALYVASIGTALGLAVDGKISEQTYWMAYAPVEKAATLCKPTSRALLSYQYWWQPNFSMIRDEDGRPLAIDSEVVGFRVCRPCCGFAP